MAKHYPGYESYSYVPEDIVVKVCPSPEPLCARCQLLDIPKFFLGLLDAISSLLEEGHLLDTIDRIIERSHSCAFCSLIVAALCARSPDCIDIAQLSPPNKRTQPLNVYLKSSHIGRYSLDEQSMQNVHCISVYTNHTEPAQTGKIRLLANDAHLLGQRPLFHGRMIGNHLPPRLLWSWIKACRNTHTRCAQVRSTWGQERLNGPRSMVLIDPVNECLIKRKMFEYNDYVALSYVWGTQQGLQLKKANRPQLFKPGSLNKASRIPTVILDAMELVKDLDPLHLQESPTPGNPNKPAKRHLFLWVDQLCIVQDDDADKAIQIQQMGQIYSDAVATIMAVDGEDSHGELARLHPIESRFSPQSAEASSTPLHPTGQVVRNIGGLRLVAALPKIEQVLHSRKWMTRAWTLQEKELSHSAILFSKHQVYFQCHAGLYQEDLVCELLPKSVMPDPDLNLLEAYPQELSSKSVPFEYRQWPETWDMYAEMVEDFLNRSMTYPTDILAAFRGIAQNLHALTSWDMPNCFPTEVLDYALLWRPTGNNRRRTTSSFHRDERSTRDEMVLQLPSYTWAAWEGRIAYRPYSPWLKSLIKRFERSVGNKLIHIPRLSQGDVNRRGLSPTLEPDDKYGPEDATPMELLPKTFGWATEMARNLSFRMHLVNRSSGMWDDDGSFILQFHTRCMNLTLGDAPPPHSPAQIQLLNQAGEKVGYAWNIPVLASFRNIEIKVLLLSMYKTDSAALAEWTQIMGVKDEMPTVERWDLINVMLVQSCPGKDALVERLTIGKIHKDFLPNAQEQVVTLA